MRILVRQCLALSVANIRSITRRVPISVSMAFSIAIVVVVLLGFLSMANGFRRTLDGTGSPDVALVVGQGTIDEAQSRVTSAQASLLDAAPGVAKGADGRPEVSAELVVPVDAERKDSARTATLSLRGIGRNGLAVRPSVKITRGRMFRPGTDEIVVGDRVAEEYRHTAVGDTISFGSSKWKVVGQFSAGGGIFESEMLADSSTVQALFDRQNQYQSVRFHLLSPGSITALSDYVSSSPQLAGLKAESERRYFAARVGGVSRIISWIGWPLAVTMAIGAAVGAMTTMYSSVSDRLVEIATVRTLGFSRTAAFAGTMAEALAITLAGSAAGIAAAWFGIDGIHASTRAGGTSAQLMFTLSMSWPLAFQAFLLAMCIGMLGGGVPAFRATRVPLRSAMSRRG